MGVITYTDAERIDVGILQEATCDFSFGSDENSFVLTLDRKAGIALERCALAYIEGTEFGGMVVSCDTNTEPSVNTLQYLGLTWHGMLDTHIIEPEPGQDYLIVSGEANAILAFLVSRLGIEDLFAASTEDSHIHIDYQFNRYVGGYTGIRRMLSSVGAKLHIEYNGERAVLSALPAVDYSITQAIDTDKLVLKMSSCFLPVNHLVCLGEGELKERNVIHLYANEKGQVSQTQTFFGSLENAMVYDYSSAGPDELMEEGVKKLEELQNVDTSEANFLEDKDYDIDDVIGTYDALTGEFVTATISKKILSVNRSGVMSVNYEIGNLSRSQDMTKASDETNIYTRIQQAQATAQKAASAALDANISISGMKTDIKNLQDSKEDKGHSHAIGDGTIGIEKLSQSLQQTIQNASAIANESIKPVRYLSDALTFSRDPNNWLDHTCLAVKDPGGGLTCNNLPSILNSASTVMAVRTVQVISDQHIALWLYESFPGNRIWTNFYNCGAWSGWKQI